MPDRTGLYCQNLVRRTEDIQMMKSRKEIRNNLKSALYFSEACYEKVVGGFLDHLLNISTMGIK